MNTSTFEQLRQQGFIDEETLLRVKDCESKRPVSVHWELKTLLYIGILLLTTGLGMLIYKNIDTIGHMAIVLLIAATSAGCFAYCIKNTGRFQYGKVKSPNVWFDYILLLGCLLLLTFIGYIQFQYGVFGERWGMATFFPMVILFVSAYYFDHLGVLSLAITNFAAWLGLTITPVRFLERNDFNEDRIIFTGLLLGIILMGLSLLSTLKKIKPHFSFTYKNFGAHVLFVSLIAAMVSFNAFYLLWFLLLAGVGYYFYFTAVKERSFYFLVIAALYFYVGLSYVLIRSLMTLSSGEGILYLTLLYLIASAIGLILFLIRQNKRFKSYAGVQ